MATQKVNLNAKKIDYGSPEQEAMNAASYGMTKANAEDIVKRYEADPKSLPFEKYEKALAYLEGISTKPVPIDTAPGHCRKQLDD